MFRGETLTYLLNNEEVLTDVFIEKDMPSSIKVFDKLMSPGVHELKLQINFTGVLYLREMVQRLSPLLTR